MSERNDDTRNVLDGDETLQAFYRGLANGEAPTSIPARLEVHDVEATLTRVWDLGGTIVSLFAPHPSSESIAGATFADPRGNLVSLVQWSVSAPA